MSRGRRSAAPRPGVHPQRVSPRLPSRGNCSESVACDEVLTTGVADAVAVAPDGNVEVVIDWKSDVRASDEARAQYRQQVRTYVRLVGAAKGLVVYATTGAVETVFRAG